MLAWACGDGAAAGEDLGSSGASSGSPDPAGDSTAGPPDAGAGGSSAGGESTIGDDGDESQGDSAGDSDESGGDTGRPTPVDLDPRAVPESVELFPRTVIAGEMRETSFMVACFVSDAQAVVLRVWLPTDDPQQVALVHEEIIEPDANGFFKAHVGGLEGGTWYDYAVFRDVGPGEPVARSLIGRVKTALAPGVREPVTVALGACVGSGGIFPDHIDPQNPVPQYWTAITEAAQHDFDLFIHLGDQGYLDNVWDAGGSYELYLNAWGAYHGGGYRELYPRAGLLCTWDDHEVTNNGDVDPWTTDPIERERIANGLRAYYTVLPIDAAVPFDDPLWRNFQWGDVVEFIVLDCLYERNSPQGRYMSEAQLAFLLTRLQDSPCHFKCILNSVPFANLDGFLGASEDNRWQGHPAQRDAVKSFIDDNAIEGVVWVTGDIHLCYVGQIENQDDTPSGRAWEVCVTSGNINPLALTLPPSQFAWADGNPHAPLLTFDADANEVAVTFYRPDGTIAFETTLSG